MLYYARPQATFEFTKPALAPSKSGYAGCALDRAGSAQKRKARKQVLLTHRDCTSLMTSLYTPDTQHNAWARSGLACRLKGNVYRRLARSSN